MANDAQLVTLIPIRNMDRAIRFYTKVLGGKLNMRGMGEMRDFWASLQVGKAEVWFVTPETREPRKLAYQTFLVKDIRKFVAQLKKQKVKFEKPTPSSKKSKVEGPIVFEEFGSVAFFKDTEGNLLMAWQNAVPM